LDTLEPCKGEAEKEHEQQHGDQSQCRLRGGAFFPCQNPEDEWHEEKGLHEKNAGDEGGVPISKYGDSKNNMVSRPIAGMKKAMPSPPYSE
jgi:hypothetical protein